MILRPVGLTPAASSGNPRYGVELSGSYDGTNRVFEFPEAVVHIPPNQAVQLYHGGRRMKYREFVIFESVVGGGYDRVRLVEFSPGPSAVLFADYQAA